jgi:hypothetical protein
MRVTLFGFVCLFAASVLFAQSETLNDAQILDAIKAGEAKKIDALTSDCFATSGFGEGMAASLAGGVQRDGSYHVIVSGSAGRMAYMAREAKRLYKKFGLGDVTEEMRQPAFVVSVYPSDPTRRSNGFSVSAVIDHVVLKSKVNADAVVQPEKVEKEPVEWSNLLGGKVESNSALALFDFNQVRELPSGDFDVVVITGHGERRCKVGLKDRQKLSLVRK